MEQNLDEPFEHVKDLLIGIAALYGHTISWGDRGKWVWDDEEKNCQLQEILELRKKNVYWNGYFLCGIIGGRRKVSIRDCLTSIELYRFIIIECIQRK